MAKRTVKALIALKPEHAEKIESGEKTVQYSKTYMRNEPSSFLISIREPEPKVLGEAEIVECIGASPERLWEWTRDQSGMTEKEFRDFFCGCSFGYAYKLGEYHECGQTADTRCLAGSPPPRPFRYIYGMQGG